MAKRTIYIDRPDGQIPGLIEVNSVLAERFGVVVSVVINTDDKDRFTWDGLELREAKVEEREIIVGDVLICAKR